MTDNDLRQVLLDAVPPLTIPPDRLEVIGARVRRQRLRFAGVSTTAAVALVAAAAVTFAMLPRAGSSATAGPVALQAGAPKSSTSAPATARTQEAARLSGELKQLMGAALPNAQFLKDSTFDTTSYDSKTGYPVVNPLVFGDEGDHFSAGARIKDSAGVGSIQVLVGHKDSTFGDSRTCPDATATKDIKFTCEVQHGPDGAVIIVSTTTRGKWQAYQVQYIRSDGNSVVVRVSNAFNTSDVATRHTPPLTRGQVVALAGTPALATRS